MAKKIRLKDDVQRQFIYAACFGVSNMGQPHAPMVDPVARLRKSWANTERRFGSVSLDSAVMAVAQQYMETDEHQRWFEEEAKAWCRKLATKTLEDIHRSWSWIEQMWTITTPGGVMDVHSYQGPHLDRDVAVRSVAALNGSCENFLVYKRGTFKPQYFVNDGIDPKTDKPWVVPMKRKGCFHSVDWEFEWVDYRHDSVRPARKAPPMVEC